MAAIIQHKDENELNLEGQPFLAKRMRNVVASTVGAIGLVVLTSGVAFAQDVDAELEALEQDAEAEAAAVEAPPAEEAPADAAAAEEEEAPAAPEKKRVQERSDELDLVEVTVDRRKKDLQDYSGVAASFSESKLSSVGINNARDLSSMVPGLQIGVQEGNTEVYIRGVGSDNNTELGDPAVALHIDGVYIPRPRGVGSMFFDIAAVEISSGPQGTLRGRNAMGGTVNIVSNRPKIGEYEANAEATFGTFAQRRYQGMVNLPIGDSFAVRAAGFSEVRDAYFENSGPVQSLEPAENADAYAIRVQAKYEPTDKFSLLVGYDRTDERGTGYLGSNVQGQLTRTYDEEDANGNLVPAGVTPFDPSEEENPRNSYLRGANNRVALKHQGIRALLSYDMGPAIVELSSSYRDLKYTQRNGSNAGYVDDDYDFSGIEPDTWGGAQWDSRSQSLINELRVYAPDDARLRWTVGAFAFQEDQQVFLGQMSDQFFGFGGGEFNMPDVKGSSYAGYADATFDVTEEFRVIAGVRMTQEAKSRNDGVWTLMSDLPNPPEGGPTRYGTEGFEYEALDRTQYKLPADYYIAEEDGGMSNLERRDARVNAYLSGVKSFGARDNLPVSLCADPLPAAPGEDQEPRVSRRADGVGYECTRGVRGNVPLNAFDSVPQNNDTSDTFFDWRVGVEYDLGKDSMVYAMATTGHKGSGFNDTVPGNPDQLGDLFNSKYNSEKVTSFEIGTKNLLLDRKLKFNASAFAYIYEGLQFQQIVAVAEPPEPLDGEEPSAPPSSALRQNAPTSNSFGLDVDLTYRLPAGLEAELHALYLDARFGDGTIVNDGRIDFGQEYQVDIGGNLLPRVSPLTLNYTLSQVIFTEYGSFNWLAQGQTRTTHYMSVFNGDGELPDPADVEGNEPLTADPRSDAPEGSPNEWQRLADIVPTYTRFDLGVGWKHPDGRISINGFVNNVLNAGYATSIIMNPGLNLRFYNPPRTAGVRFRVEW